MTHLKALNFLNKIIAFLLALSSAVTAYLAYMAMNVGSLSVAAFPFLCTVALVVAAGFLWMLGDRLLLGHWKTAQVAVAMLMLPAFPVGTVYGAYALWVCLKSEAAGSAYTEMSELEIFA